jgi:transcriptional regulator with XRE-family HTH domain
MASRTEEEQDLVALQDRFARGLTWLRRHAGRTQRDVAEFVGWHQPYVARLENPAESSLLKSLTLLESYARACGATTLVTFVDPATGEIVGHLPMSDEAEAAADRLHLAEPPDEPLQVDIEAPENLGELLARGAERT